MFLSRPVVGIYSHSFKEGHRIRTDSRYLKPVRNDSWQSQHLAAMITASMAISSSHGRTEPSDRQQNMPHDYPNAFWGHRCDTTIPVTGLCEFELYTQQLGLREHEYAASLELRKWCDEHKNRCYIPEWLLKLWRMHDGRR